MKDNFQAYFFSQRAQSLLSRATTRNKCMFLFGYTFGRSLQFDNVLFMSYCYRKSCECIVKTELGHLGGRLKFYPKLWLSEYKLAHLHTCRNFLAHLHTCLNFLAHLHTCRNFRMS